jgi:hypothetical protein
MDTLKCVRDHFDTLSDEAKPVRTEVEANLSAFIGSEEFVPFVLACLTRSARKAVAENAALKVQQKPT